MVLVADHFEPIFLILQDEGVEVLRVRKRYRPPEARDEDLSGAVSVYICHIEGQKVLVGLSLQFFQEPEPLLGIFIDPDVMLVHDDHFVLAVPIHIGDIQPYGFKGKFLALLEAHALLGMNDGALLGPDDIRGFGPRLALFPDDRGFSQDLTADIPGEFVHLRHELIQPLGLGKDAGWGFSALDIDQPGIEADEIDDLGDAAQYDVIRHEPLPGLAGNLIGYL